MKNSLLTVIFIAVVCVGLGSYFSYSFAEQKAPGEVLYTAKLQAVPTQYASSSSEVSPLARYRDRVLVVNFWATWCPPCVEEIPDLSGLQKKLSGHHVTFIGIGLDPMNKLTDFAQLHAITYPLFEAEKEGYKLSTQLGNKTGSVPFTVLFTKAGLIKETYSGRVDIKKLEQDILAAL